MALAPLTHAPVTLVAAALLLAGAAATAIILAHTLRKTRSQDWVVALGWGLGGSLAAGTGLWVLQLAAWHTTHAGNAAWFLATPFVGAWLVAMGVCALLALLTRWVTAQWLVNAITMLLMLPLMTMLFVVLGSAMAVPPQWHWRR